MFFLIGQWCSVLASLPHRLSSASAFWLVILECITLINYSNFSSSLPSFTVLYSTYTLSTSFEIFFHFLLCHKLAHCFWLPATGRRDLSVFATGCTLTVAVFTLFHLFISHWFSPSSSFPPPPPLFSPWMTWLPYPVSCSFTSWFKNKPVVSVLAMPLWSGGS